MKPSSLLCHLRLFCLPAVFVLSLALSAQAAQFPIATNSIQYPFPRAAFDGTNYLVGLQIIRANGTSEPRAQLVSSSGALIGSQIETGRTGDPPMVSYAGPNYLLAWADYSASANGNVPIFGQLIGTTGSVIGSPFQISQSTNVNELESVTSGRTNMLITWADRTRPENLPGSRDIFARFVSTSGTPQGADFKISGAAGKGSAGAFDGTNFFVIWRDDVNDTDIYGRLLSPTGTFVTAQFLVDGNAFPSDNEGTVIFDGTKYFVTLGDEVGGQGSGEWDIFGRFVTTSGTVLTNRIAISTAPGRQILPSVAFDGANYLVGWLDGFGSTNGTNANTKARFLDSAGAALSSEFILSSTQGSKASLTPSLLFDGRRFFGVVGLGEVLTNGTGEVVGFTNGVVEGFFVNPLPRGTFPIAISSGQEFGLGAAFDGTNYLVGISQQGGPGVTDEIIAQLISSTGAPVGARIRTGRFGGAPFFGFDGTNYLLVWEDVVIVDTIETKHIYGQFISPAGTLVRPPFAISTATGNQLLDGINHVAFDGTNYLVVWRDERNGSGNRDIYGRLVSPAGTLFGSEIAITTQAENEQEASAAFDGTNYMVVWQTKRSAPPELYDTYGKLISKAGVPGTAFLISQNPSARHNPTSLAFDGTNYLAVWNRDIGPGFPSPEDWDIYARLVTRSGTFVGNEFPITTAAGSQISFGTTIFDGTSFLVNWIDAPKGSMGSRFFNRLGIPLGSEFSLFGSQGTRFPIGGFFFGGGRLFATASYLDSNFKNGDVYGLFVPIARLDFAAPVANGQVPLRFTGMPGVTYAIQATTNLVSANIVWTTVTTSNSLSGTFDFTDTNATGYSRRFYRALLP